MQKIKNFILSINFNTLVFVLIGIRIAIYGASIGDAIAIAALSGLVGFIRWSESQKLMDYNKSLENDIAGMKVTLEKELTDIKSSVGGLVIKNTLRPSSTDQGPRKFF